MAFWLDRLMTFFADCGFTSLAFFGIDTLVGGSGGEARRREPPVGALAFPDGRLLRLFGAGWNVINRSVSSE